METVCRSEIFGIFSNDFRPIPGGKRREAVGMHREKSRKYPAGILFPCSGDVRRVPIEDPAFFPSLSCRFLRDLVTRIFDLGR